jgi:hypothetical protein
MLIHIEEPRRPLINDALREKSDTSSKYSNSSGQTMNLDLHPWIAEGTSCFPTKKLIGHDTNCGIKHEQVLEML